MAQTIRYYSGTQSGGSSSVIYTAAANKTAKVIVTKFSGSGLGSGSYVGDCYVQTGMGGSVSLGGVGISGVAASVVPGRGQSLIGDSAGNALVVTTEFYTKSVTVNASTASFSYAFIVIEEDSAN